MTMHLIGLARLFHGGVTPFNAELLPLGRYLTFAAVVDAVDAKAKGEK